MRLSECRTPAPVVVRRGYLSLTALLSADDITSGDRLRARGLRDCRPGPQHPRRAGAFQRNHHRRYSGITQPVCNKSVKIGRGEVAVFLTCGVASQAVAYFSRRTLMISRAAGHVLVAGRLDAVLREHLDRLAEPSSFPNGIMTGYHACGT